MSLAPMRPVEASREPSVAVDLLPGDGSRAVELLAPEHAVEPIDANGRGEMRDAWVLGGAGPKRIEIAGPFDPATFNRVRVFSIPGDIETVRVLLVRERGKELGTPGVRLGGVRSAYWHDFDLGGMRAQKAPFDRLEIRFDGPSQRVCLLQVELVLVPWTSFLPDPAGLAELVRVGDDSRRARALGGGIELAAEFDAPELDGSRLAFSFAQPELVRAGMKPIGVGVRLSSGRGEPYEEIVPLKFGKLDAWQEHAIPLERFAGDRVRVEFRVEGDAGEVLALGEPLVCAGAATSRAPTVLLVTSDTHRADHVGLASGGARVRTPMLDALAARGMFFEDCWSSTNVTRPSHVSLLTSVTPRDTGIVTNFQRLQDEAATLAEAFRAAGYATFAAVSAAPLDDRFSGLGQGFDRMSSPDEAQRDAAATIARLSAWLPSAEGFPLFVWMHLFDAHAPYVVPEEYRRLHYPAERDPYDASLPELAGRARPDWDPAVRDPEWVLAQYGAQVSYLDDRLAGLFVLPRFAEAIVAVTADHGESLDAHGIYYSHAELYPDTLHVPLILAWPGAHGGERVTRSVLQIDVGRTLLDLAGLAETPFPGTNLVDDASGVEEPARFALSSQATSASIQVGRWFLVLHLEEGEMENGRSRPRHGIELYDLAADPRCVDELSTRLPEEAQKLRAQLVLWLVAAQTRRYRAGDSAPRAEEIQRMAELGYAEGESEPSSSVWFDAECACAACLAFER